MATQYETVRLDETPSTQDEALQRVRDGATGAVLVTTDRQTGGRGRSGRAWLHAPRAIAASLAFVPRPDLWPEDRLPVMTLVAGLAACAALDEGVRLKWPNDVMVGGVKAGGILSEVHDGIVVIGCGVNLWWPSPPDGVGALYAEDPGPEATQLLSQRWADEVIARQQSGPADWGHDEYARLCDTVGSGITWTPDGRGVARRIDANGGLVVATPDGEVTITSGEVRHVRHTTMPPAPDTEAERR